MADLAAAYVRQLGAGDQLFKDYFGGNSASDVARNFDYIKNANSHDVVIRCTGASCNSAGASNAAGTNVIEVCGSFWSQFTNSDLCKKKASPTSTNLRGATMVRLLARTFTPGVAGQARSCDQSRGLSNFDKITNNDNYGASTHTPHYLPRARVLTWDRDLCSASLPKSLPGGGVKWMMRTLEREEFRTLCVDSLIIPALITTFESFVRRNRICQIAGFHKEPPANYAGLVLPLNARPSSSASVYGVFREACWHYYVLDRTTLGKRGTKKLSLVQNEIQPQVQRRKCPWIEA